VDAMTDLLSAVHALTRPVHRKIIQDNPDGPETTRVVTIIDQPLLEQLDAAIGSNAGGSTHGGSDPRTRSVMNLGAYETAKTIEDKVRGWARMAGAEVDKGSLAKTLEHWHIKFIGNALVVDHDGHTKILRGWAATIRATLEPEKELDFAEPCPACGSDCWYNAATEQSYPRPLVIRYKPGDIGIVQTATGLCRACHKTWGVRELAYALEADETEETG